MKITFSEIEAGKSSYDFDVGPAEMNFDYPDARFQERVNATVKAFASGDEIIIDGTVETSAIMECSRCLADFEIKLKAPVKLIIQRNDEMQDDDTGDENFDIVSKSVNEYDLAPYCREQLLVELPNKPLCSEACEGLCPVCGGNLNETHCDCSIESDSGHWEKLREIFKGGNS